MNGFIKWHLWIKNLFTNEVLNKYNRLIIEQNRIAKTEFVDALYDDEFIKLKAKRFFMLKSKDAFQLQIITKVKCLALIKSILASKLKTSLKLKKFHHTKS